MLSCCSSASVCFTARQRCWSRAAGAGAHGWPKHQNTCHPHPCHQNRPRPAFRVRSARDFPPTQHDMASQHARCGRQPRLRGLKATAVSLLLMLGERKPRSRTRTELHPTEIQHQTSLLLARLSPAQVWRLQRPLWLLQSALRCRPGAVKAGGSFRGRLCYRSYRGTPQRALWR